MKNLEKIAQMANDRLFKEVFTLKDDGTTVWNIDNRCEGNSISMREETGKFVLSITGHTEVYDTIVDAVYGLIEMYNDDDF